MTFILICLGLCIVAAAFILIPLSFSRGDGDAVSKALSEELSEEEKIRVSVNVSIYSERHAEYQTSLDQADIDEAEFAALELELKRNLLADAPAEAKGEAQQQKQANKLPIAFAVLVPCLAVFLYADFGLSWGAMPDVELAEEIKTADPHDSDAMTAMVLKLERRLKKQPENFEGWFLLSQSYMNMQQFEKAAKAFKYLKDAFPRDPKMASYYAEAIYMADERQFTKRSQTAIDATLKLNPKDLTMLEIKAVSLFQAGKLAESITWFKKALAVSTDESRSKFLKAAITRLEQDLGIEPSSIASAAESAENIEQKVAQDQTATSSRRIQILVEVADTVDAGASASVFVFARAINGPPMPLAVQRMVKGALPKLVELDESMAMMAGMGLANFDQVEVVARISSSGIANVSPDDYEAISAPLDLTQPLSVIKLTLVNKVKDRK